MIVNQGLNHILDTELHGSTQVTTWYIGLKGSGAAAAADTLASHTNWAEVTDYTGDRKEFVEGAASSQSISNSGNAASFSINGSCTIAGMFLCSAASGSSGTLFSVKDFSSSRSLASGDTLTVTYTVSASSS